MFQMLPLYLCLGPSGIKRAVSDSSKLTHLEVSRYLPQLTPKETFYTGWTAAAVLVLIAPMQRDLQQTEKQHLTCSL